MPIRSPVLIYFSLDSGREVLAKGNKFHLYTRHLGVGKQGQSCQRRNRVMLPARNNLFHLALHVSELEKELYRVTK